MKTAMVFAGCLLMMGGSATRAHHSVASHFDMSRSVEIRGVVVDFKLRSPHASLIVDGQSYEHGVLQDETVQRWEIESSAAPGLRAMGIERDTFRAGDAITVIAAPNRQQGFRFVNSSTFIDGEGRQYSRASVARLASPTSNSLANLQGISRMSGRWSSPGAFARSGGTPLPLNEAGREAYDNYDPRLSPANSCEAMNIPDIFNAPYLFDLRADANELLIHNQPWDVERRVVLNDQAVRSEPDGVFGIIKGRVEGNAIVLESDSYPPSRWGLGSATQFLGSGADIPSSSEKKVTERFSLSDDGLTLNYDYTLEDPAYLGQPFNGRLSFVRVAADTPMYPYDCDEESASMFSRTPDDSPLQTSD